MKKDSPARGAIVAQGGAALQPFPPDLDPLLRERMRFVVTGVSRSAWYELMSKGEAPKPVAIGARAVAWRASDLKKWADSRAQQGATQ